MPPGDFLSYLRMVPVRSRTGHSGAGSASSYAQSAALNQRSPPSVGSCPCFCPPDIPRPLPATGVALTGSSPSSASARRGGRPWPFPARARTPESRPESLTPHHENGGHQGDSRESNNCLRLHAPHGPPMTRLPNDGPAPSHAGHLPRWQPRGDWPDIAHRTPPSTGRPRDRAATAAGRVPVARLSLRASRSPGHSTSTRMRPGRRRPCAARRPKLPKGFNRRRWIGQGVESSPSPLRPLPRPSRTRHAGAVQVAYPPPFRGVDPSHAGRPCVRPFRGDFGGGGRPGDEPADRLPREWGRSRPFIGVMSGPGEEFRTPITRAASQLWKGGDPVIRQTIFAAPPSRHYHEGTLNVVYHRSGDTTRADRSRDDGR